MLERILDLVNEYGNLASVVGLFISIVGILITIIIKLIKVYIKNKKEHQNILMNFRKKFLDLTEKATTQIKRQEVYMYIDLTLSDLRASESRRLLLTCTMIIIMLMITLIYVVLYHLNGDKSFIYISISIFILSIIYGVISLRLLNQLRGIIKTIHDEYIEYLSTVISKH